MFTLIDLPYASNALEPVISADTLGFHHGKHLQGYVDNLNKLIVGTEFEGLCHSERSEESLLAEIIRRASLPAPTGNPAIFNNAGQILNHNLYFTQFRPFDAAAPSSLPAPTGNLLAQITKQWGTLDAFKKEFEDAGAGIFGSGWVWLAADSEGVLSILRCPGADNPVTRVMPGSTGHLRPILTFDVWEHAYYLDYQNRRPAHLAALWDIVDWKVLEERYLR